MQSTQLAQRNTVLVIDDELGPRESLRFLLKNDYDVCCASSVDEGLDYLRQHPFDTVILDIKMPDKSGIEGLREIRGIDQTVSILMVTGFGSLETAQEAIRLGANDYIKKPFDTREMRQTVARHIQRTSLERKRASTVHDLEELNQQLQREAAKKEILASLGRASSELVHDIRNPLTVIQGYLQILKDDLDASSHPKADTRQQTEYLEIMSKNVKRCQEMAQTWKSLGKRDPSSMAPCRIEVLLDDVAASLRSAAEEAGGRIDILAGPSDCVVLADQIQLFRAFQNIVTNAIHAFPDKDGLVRIRWSKTNDNVQVEVEDNGCGIPPDRLALVFDPDYTTRSARGGMGLGLFITKRVVEDTHEGIVRLANRPEYGTVATVTLPRLKMQPV